MNSLEPFMSQLRQVAAEGGWVFWVLIALAFGIAFALISIVHLLRLPDAPRLTAGEWLRLLRNRNGIGDEPEIQRLLPVVEEMPLIEQQLFAQVDRRVRFAFVLIGAAPLVGLLGTVGGMLTTFRGLSSSAAQAPIDVISGGVSEALITTQTGLVIAVPTFIVAIVLKSHLQQMRFGFQKLEAALRRIQATAATPASLSR